MGKFDSPILFHDVPPEYFMDFWTPNVFFVCSLASALCVCFAPESGLQSGFTLALMQW